MDLGVTYTHTWDALNRMASVSAPAKDTAWRYDADGQRVSKADGVGTTVYIGDAVEVQISGTMRLTTTYYFFGGARIAMQKAGGLTYLHGDRIGSASLATDASGNTVSQERFDVWGVASMMSGTMPTDFQWQNQRRLDESQTGKLYDFNARFFTPVAARFISPDSIVPNPANPQSLNRYAALANNPLKFTDPTGHRACNDVDDCESPGGGGGGGGGGAGGGGGRGCGIDYDCHKPKLPVPKPVIPFNPINVSISQAYAALVSTRVGRELIGFLGRRNVMVTVGYWMFDASLQFSNFLFGHEIHLGRNVVSLKVNEQAALLGHELMHVLQRVMGNIPAGQTTTKEAERIANMAQDSIQSELPGQQVDPVYIPAMQARLNATNGINSSYRWLDSFTGSVGDTYRAADPGTTQAGMVPLILQGMGFSQAAVVSVYEAAQLPSPYGTP